MPDRSKMERTILTEAEILCEAAGLVNVGLDHLGYEALVLMDQDRDSESWALFSAALDVCAELPVGDRSIVALLAAAMEALTP